MRALLLDLSFAVRSLGKSPGFTTVALATLALVIACNAIVFTVVNAVLLHPLPYPDAGKLVVVHRQERSGPSIGDVSAPTFFLVKERARSFESVAAIYASGMGINLAGAESTHYIKALGVSRDFLKVLGIMPAIGRDFRPDEDLPNGPHSTILSYGLWERTFSKSPSVLGSRVRINSEDYAVVGIMPRNFRSYPEADLWLPLQLAPATADPGNDYRVIGRLQAGLTTQQAQEELRTVAERFPIRHLPQSGHVTLVLQGMQAFETRDVRGRLVLLFAAAAFLLMIACANLALLLVVRASARNHEIAIRAALGASRARLIQVFLVESAVLAVLGGLSGVILAKELLPLVLSLAPVSLPQSADIAINGRVILFTLSISAITCLLFGLAPALPTYRGGLYEMLQQSTRGASASPSQRYLGRILISAQTALTLVLLAGAFLMLKNFRSVERVHSGFDPDNVSVAQISLAAQRYQSTAFSSALLGQVFQKLATIPGIEAVATVNGLPMENGLNLPIYPTDAGDKIEHKGEYRIISGDYFQAMRIPLVQGKSFSDRDRAETRPVAIVNETLARRWWPQGSPLGNFVAVGKELGQQFSDQPRVVIGVAADIRQSGLDRPAPPTIFIPVQQAPDKITAFVNKLFLTSIVVRTANRTDVSKQIRNAVISADPDLSLASLRPLSDVIATSLARDRFYAYLTAVFAAFALLITAIGLYGLMSYQIILRAPEIIVRMSLGARRIQVVLLVVKEGIQLVVIGLLGGVMGAFFLLQVVTNMVYNQTTAALKAVITASLLLGIIAVLSSLLTGIRMAFVELMVVLRNE